MFVIVLVTTVIGFNVHVMSLDYYYPSRHQPTSTHIIFYHTFLQGLKEEELKCYSTNQTKCAHKWIYHSTGYCTYIPHATPPTLALPPTP